jgi:hypothetical protein
MQRHRITGTIKGLPTRMFGIWFEVSHFDRHPVWLARAVSADLSADHPPGRIIGSTADSSKAVDFLMVVTIEDRPQIGASLIRDDGITADQNTDREYYTKTKNPHVSPRIEDVKQLSVIYTNAVFKYNKKNVKKVNKFLVSAGQYFVLPVTAIGSAFEQVVCDERAI